MIEDGGLAGRDGEERLVGLDANGVTAWKDARGGGAVIVADFNEAFARGGERRGAPRDILHGETGTLGIGAGADDDAVELGIDAHDVEGVGVGDAEAGALADGEESGAVMRAEAAAVQINDVAWLQDWGVWGAGGQEGAIVIVRDEADFLAFWFGGNWEMEGSSEGADMSF